MCFVNFHCGVNIDSSLCWQVGACVPACHKSQSVRLNEKAQQTHTNTCNPPASAVSLSEGVRSHGVALLLPAD